MFNTKVSLYGIFIIIAIISGLLVVYKNTKHLYLKSEENVGLLLYIGLGAIFGAKYFPFLINSKKYHGVFEFTKIGLSSYGAIIGIIILLFLFSKQYKKSFKDLLYIMLPSIPLMYGIGKIGCFLAGCCYGIKYDGPLSVSYNYSYSAPKGIKLFPIQMLETIIFIGIFIYAYNKVNKNKPNYIIIGQIFVICGISKFLLDYLRISHVGKLFSINQIVSMAFILVGFFLILRPAKYQKKFYK